MKGKEKIEERLKQRQEELQKNQKRLNEMNSFIEKTTNDIRSTRDVIVYLTGAIQETQELLKIAAEEETKENKCQE
jgi:methylthioribose-1-phosphate isomerase